MNKNLIASSTILINSTPQKIWDVLTNPEKVKIYLFGTKIKTDWKKGTKFIALLVPPLSMIGSS